MRVVIALALSWLTAAAAWAGVAASLPRIALYGQSYVDLSAWARLNRLQLSWDKPSGEVRLTNRWTRLAFTVDSRRAEVNGVRTWLSIPITPRNQNLLIGDLDLKTLLEPVLNPPRNRRGQRIRTVVLDPGHGGKDPGNQVGTHQEKDYTLALALTLRQVLRDAGLRVFLTRSSDQFIDLPLRPATANRYAADLFVSLHYNAASHDQHDVKGVEVYCLTPAGAQSTNAQGEGSATGPVSGNVNNPKNVLLAYQVEKALVNGLRVEDRGVRRARFAVLRTPLMPTILIEGGFMTYPEEAREIFDSKHRLELARAITDGILAYKRLVER